MQLKKKHHKPPIQKDLVDADIQHVNKTLKYLANCMKCIVRTVVKIELVGYPTMEKD